MDKLKNMWVSLLLGLILVLSASAKDVKTYRGHKVLSVQAKTRDQLEFLHHLEMDEPQLDFWSRPSLVNPTDIRVPPALYGFVMGKMNEAGLSPEIRHDDVQSLIEKEQEAMSHARAMSPFAQKDITQEYFTFDEIEDFLTTLAQTFPGRVEKSSMGMTEKNQPIIQIRISSNLADRSKPAVWVEALTHAREWIAGATALYTIRRLAEYADTEAQQMLDMYDWYFAPVHNPDGYIYSHNTDRMWRKNRREEERCSWYGCLPCYGTDLNRNWDISWSGAGTSSDCNSDLYHGQSPFSEKETTALRDAVMATPNRKAFFSIHAYSQLLLIPYAYKETRPSDYDDLEKAAIVAQRAIENTHGKIYQVGTPPSILYAATGGAFDYMKDQLGIKWSYTYELRPADQSNGGFLLHPSEILPTAEELFASLYSFAKYIKDK